MKLCASSGATPEMVHSTFICSLKEALAGTADHCGSDSSLRPSRHFMCNHSAAVLVASSA